MVSIAPSCTARQRIEQIARRFWCAAHRVAGGGEIVEGAITLAGTSRPTAYPVRPGRAGIIRHQHRDAPLAARQRAQAHQRGDAVGDHRDAIRLGPARQRGEGKTVLRRQRILEGDGAGEHAAVEFGQHDVHREIGGAEPARAVAPGGAPGGGADHLQHRHARRIERRRLVGIAAGGERRRGDDHRGIEPGKARPGAGTRRRRDPSGW